MRIACVFFDYDGVLTTDRTGSMTTCGFISRRTGIPLDQVSAALAKHNTALTLGLMSYADVWWQICEDLHQDLPLHLLQEAFDSTPVNVGMFELAAQLRRACRVGIITDNKADRMRRLRIVQKLDAHFDPIVVSADVGKSKSSPALFEHALARIGLLAERAVFIDNDPGNVAMAASIGMNAIHFDDALNDVSRLAVRLHQDFGLHLR